MKRSLCLLLSLVLLSLCVLAQADVPLKNKYFPDKAFLDYVRQNFDADEDGALSDEEIEQITYLQLDNLGIKNLKGIEYLKNLRNLWCNDNQITVLDLRRNSLLEELHCARNSIVNLDLSKNTELWYVDCQENQLKKLLLGRNRRLVVLNCRFNHELATLDISNCTNLADLDATITGVEELDLTPFTNLSTFVFNGEPENVYTIKIGNHPKLETFNACLGKVKKLDFSGCPALKELSLCEMRSLTSITLGNMPKLTTLDIAQAFSLNSIDLTGCGKIAKLTSTEPRQGIFVRHFLWQKGKDGTANFLYVVLPDTVKYTNGYGEKVSKLTLNKKKLTLNIGDEYILKKTIAPKDAVNQPVKWTSSNKKIATVDQDGKVTAVRAGTCTITCTAMDGSNKKANCKIKVSGGN